jgi:hypothetical protein
MIETPESKQDVLLHALRRFYAIDHNLQQLKNVLTEEKGIVSLRVLDWLVTNYAKKYNITYFVTGKDGLPVIFNVFIEYKSQLKAYSKRFFDPFCRRDRILFTAKDGFQLWTTCGQLNFFRWAITNGVVKYAVDHAQEIDADNEASTGHRVKYAIDQAQESTGLLVDNETSTGHRFLELKKSRRRELCKAAIRLCIKTRIPGGVIRFT